MRGKCKTCRYHVFEKIDRGYVCVNPDSENVTEWIACEEMGFQYIGCEIDEEYYKKSQERMERHRAQISIVQLMNDWRLP